MLFFTTKRLLPTIQNIFSIPLSNDGYIHIDSNLFRDGVILNNNKRLYSFERLVLEIKDEQAPIRDSINRLYKDLDDYNLQPIQILTPLLYLTENEIIEFEEQIGALHIISMTISPLKWIKAGKNMRNMGLISDTFKREYKNSWSVYESSCINLENILKPEEIAKPTYPIFVINATNSLLPSKEVQKQKPIEEQKQTSVILDRETKPIDKVSPDKSKRKLFDFSGLDFEKLAKENMEKLCNKIKEEKTESNDKKQDNLRKPLDKLEIPTTGDYSELFKQLNQIENN